LLARQRGQPIRDGIGPDGSRQHVTGVRPGSDQGQTRVRPPLPVAVV
jgi:hypothetical protein